MYNGHQQCLWHRKSLIKGPMQHSGHSRGAFEGSIFLRHQVFKEGVRVCLRGALGMVKEGLKESGILRLGT